MSQSLQALLADFVTSNVPDIVIEGIAADSRKVCQGDLFLVVPGAQGDGRLFIQDAIDRGAVAIAIDQTLCNGAHYSLPCIAVPNLGHRVSELAGVFYGHPSKQLSIVGITGTNGKTSTALFVANVLQTLGKPTGIIGTLGIGMPGQLLDTGNTTPGPVLFQSTLADFVSQNIHAAAVEISSHAIVQGRVRDVQFDTAVFTNLTRDHLDYHGTMEAYGEAKAQLFRMTGLRTAVVNVDCPFGYSLSQELSSQAISLLTYGIENPKADVSVLSLKESHRGLRFRVLSPWGEANVESGLLGRFNVSNLLAVLATVCSQGLPFEKVISALEQLAPTPGRMQAITVLSKQALVVVDYAHTPDALEKALSVLKSHAKGQIICVFGCGGDRDVGKRPLMGAIAQQYADQVIVTDDNPRTEQPEQIIQDILEGMVDQSFSDSLTVIHNRGEAIKQALSWAGENDTVLIAGKGHEDYQEIHGVKQHFSDIEFARSILSEGEC